MICEICKKELNVRGFGYHLKKTHSTDILKYYKKFVNSDNICKNENCQNETLFKNIKSGFHPYCSVRCMANSETTKEKRKSTCLDRFGENNPAKLKDNTEKSRVTCLRKYGAEHSSQSEEVKEKSKLTCLDKYGVPYSLQSAEVRNKGKHTNLKKLGVENPFQSEEIKEKIREINIEKYGTEFPLQNSDVLEKIKKTNIEKYGTEWTTNVKYIREKMIKTLKESISENLEKSVSEYDINIISEYENCKLDTLVECTLCKNIFSTKLDYIKQGYGKCPKCYPRLSGISQKEKELVEFLHSLNIQIIENSKDIISPKELDIYIPSHRVAFEFNGLYWHSEENGKDKDYHLNKTISCEEKSIDLYHIFEDEWECKKDVVKHNIRNILGLNNYIDDEYRIEIKEIDEQTKNNFLFKYNLFMDSRSDLNLGLFLKDELISVMTFLKQDLNWMLNNICHSKYTDRFEYKMLTYFKSNYQWEEIHLYSNRRFPYLKSLTDNFHFDSYKEQQHYLTETLNKSNFTIWDCGKIKFKCGRFQNERR